MDIKTLKNNELREKFLEDRNPDEGWYVWLDQPEVGRIFYRNDINGTAFIIELMEIFTKNKRIWCVDKYYLIPVGEVEKESRKKSFSAYLANKTMCIDTLKKMKMRSKICTKRSMVQRDSLGH